MNVKVISLHSKMAVFLCARDSCFSLSFSLSLSIGDLIDSPRQSTIVVDRIRENSRRQPTFCILVMIRDFYNILEISFKDDLNVRVVLASRLLFFHLNTKRLHWRHSKHYFNPSSFLHRQFND